MPCKLCIERGRPDYFKSEPECAFEKGVFDSNNWQCVTAVSIRRLTYDDSPVPEYKRFYRRVSDNSIGLLMCDPDSDDYELCEWDWLIVNWYKDRGSTMSIRWAKDGTPITLAQAEEILARWSRVVRQPKEDSMSHLTVTPAGNTKVDSDKLRRLLLVRKHETID